MENLNQYLNTAVAAARAAEKVFIKNFGHPHTISQKDGNPRNLVTEVDKKIESLIRQLLLKKFPSHKIIGEEYTQDSVEKNDLVWIIDPIDGTTNYIQGVPVCCVSVALWDNRGPLVGVIYNPALNLMFTAKRGHGAYLNGHSIKVGQKTKLIQAYGGFGWGRDIRKASTNFPKLIQMLNKIRTLGSTAMELAFVAAGNFDFHIQAKINVWDFAAAALLITEAGGKLTDWSGRPINFKTSCLVAANPKLHQRLLAETKKLTN